MLNGGTLNYFAVPWGIAANPLPLFAVVAVEIGLMAAVENYRRTGGLSTTGYCISAGRKGAEQGSACPAQDQKGQHPASVGASICPEYAASSTSCRVLARA